MGNEEKSVDLKNEFLARLFGNASELEGAELDLFFDAAAPELDAKEEVQKIAQAVATQLRENKQKIPAHLERALKVTRKQPFESLGTVALRKIVEELKKPALGSVDDPVFAHRSLKEDDVTEEDGEILDELTEELKEDWKDDDEES